MPAFDFDSTVLRLARLILYDLLVNSTKNALALSIQYFQPDPVTKLHE